MGNFDYILKFAEYFNKLAFKALKGVLRKVQAPIIVLEQGDLTAYATTLIPLKEVGEQLVPVGMVNLDPPNLPMNPEHNPNDWKRISGIWAEDSWTALYLFGAALYYAGKVVTDYSVTPAAQAVMRRAYSKNPDLVVPNVLVPNEQTADKPWMTAGYLNSGEGDAQYAQALQVGEEIKKMIPEEHLYQLVGIIQNKWESNIADVERTQEDRGEKIEQEVSEESPLKKEPEMVQMNG